MKLAEALNLRADIKVRISELRSRLVANAKVQEGDTPSEDPVHLLQELELHIAELESLIKGINRTNCSTYDGGRSITDMIARRDVLALKISVLRDFITEAREKVDRYSAKEIKILSTVDVAGEQEKIGKLSKELRELDTQIQGLNWTTEIIE